MKSIDHPVITALGLCAVGLLFLVGPFVSPSHLFIYHLSGSAVAMFGSVLIDFCIVWLFLSVLFFLAQRFRWLQLAVWTGIVAFLPWLAAKNVVMLELWPFPRWCSVLLVAVPISFLAALLLLPRAVAARVFNRVQHFCKVLLGLAALPGLLLVVQLPWFAWQARSLNPVFQSRRVAPGESQVKRTRIVWILFDELSYRQAFEERFHGVSLPAFDRLAAQSTLFTHVAPAGFLTEVVLPSLIVGTTVDELRVSASGLLRAVHDSATHSWRPFDQRNTVFHDAQAAGYHTGIAGWYNPYCRILPEVLDSCFWRFRPGTISYIPEQQASSGAWPSPLYLFSYFGGWLRLPHTTPPADVFAQRQIDDFREIGTAAAALINDPGVDFTFIHMPVPHPHGIYDRKTGKFATHGTSYIDNLVLADNFLAHLRGELEQRGQWDSSAVVVMGDHSWRTELWETTPIWTPEEAEASRHGFDDRPAYLVKMPGQKEAFRVDAAYPAVRSRELFDGLMGSRLQTADDVVRWAQEKP